MSRIGLCLFAALTLAGAPALAQAPEPAWAACRAAPKRACVLAEATRSARSLNQAVSRAEGLDTIVRALTEGKRFEDAIALSSSLRQESGGLVVRTRLVAALAMAGRYADADRALRAIRDPAWRAVAEAAIADHLAAKGDVAGAKAKVRIALQLAQGAGRSGDFAISHIATGMIRSGEIDEAVAVVRTIVAPTWRLRGLIDVATVLSPTRPDFALELLREASKVASAQGNPVWGIYDMRDVAVAQAGAGSTTEARATLERAADVARGFSDPGSRDTFLEVVGVGFSAAGLMAEAVMLARTMDGDWSRVRIATAAGAAEAKAGRRIEAAAAYELAAQAADEGRPAARPFLYAHIADSEAGAGFAERVPTSLDRMDKAAALLEGTSRAQALATAAMARIRHGGDDAAAAATAITDADVRDAALRSLVEEQIKAGRLDAAKAAALAITAPMDRAYPLSRVATAQARAGNVADALESLDAMSPIHFLRVDALAAIAAALEQ
jgi:hypothetical protein